MVDLPLSLMIFHTNIFDVYLALHHEYDLSSPTPRGGIMISLVSQIAQFFDDAWPDRDLAAPAAFRSDSCTWKQQASSNIGCNYHEDPTAANGTISSCYSPVPEKNIMTLSGGRR